MTAGRDDRERPLKRSLFVRPKRGTIKSSLRKGTLSYFFLGGHNKIILTKERRNHKGMTLVMDKVQIIKG